MSLVLHLKAAHHKTQHTSHVAPRAPDDAYQESAIKGMKRDTVVVKYSMGATQGQAAEENKQG